MPQRAILPAIYALQTCVLPASLLLLAVFACAGAENSPFAIAGGGASPPDALYAGGTSVIPSSENDRDAGSEGAVGSGYGSSDGSVVAPCPRDAAMDAPGQASAITPLEAGVKDSEVVQEGGDDGAACPGSLSAGDLVIDELMIASQSGVGDHGEWVEVANTRDCALDLNGLFAEVPHGKGSTIASITSDLWLPPHGFFLIADSAEPAENHSLPGMLVTWGTGTSSDVLKNSGDTITLYTANVMVDMLTYPESAKLVDGASMAFPADCAPSLRAEFGNWQPSVASWTPGFFGTPAASNNDVSCAVLPPPSPPSLPCGG
jgi:hypothetical protein